MPCSLLIEFNPYRSLHQICSYNLIHYLQLQLYINVLTSDLHSVIRSLIVCVRPIEDLESFSKGT